MEDVKRRMRYFTQADLEEHCTTDSAWVCIYNTVFDVTKPISENFKQRGAENLMRQAGKDVSHLFNKSTGTPVFKHHFLKQSGNDETGNALLHFDDTFLSADPRNSCTPWYKDESLKVGLLSENEVTVRIVNMLTYDENLLVVPAEETLNEICERYLKFNYHARSYTWKDIEHRKLDMEKTLEGNGIQEDIQLMNYLNIPEAQRPVSTIFLHFNDDLTDK